MELKKLTRLDWLIGGSIAAVYFILLCLTLDIGFPRDEGYYFNAGELYSKWFDELVKNPKNAFRKEVVNHHFEYNPEHPALPKILFGLSWRIFGKFHDPEEEPETKWWYDGGKPPKPVIPVLRESTAFRLPALILNSVLVLFIYFFTVQIFTRRAGIIAAGSFALMPHAFFHAHLACFDMPVTAMWFITAYAFFRSEHGGGWKWIILTGVCWGLALNTKHNAFFIPPTLFLCYFFGNLHKFGFERDTVMGKIRGIKLPHFPLAFLSMIIIGPILYYLLWPKLWFDPVEHLKFYISRHGKHEYYWAYYFGTLYTKPPFPIAFPFVMSAMTIPAHTVIMGMAGWICFSVQRIYSLLKRNVEALGINAPQGTYSFLFINFFIPFAMIAHPQVPHFGGTKHWLPGVPFFAMFAGLAFEMSMRAVGSFFREHGKENAVAGPVRNFIIAFVFGSFLIVPSLFETIHNHTNGSTYYNAFSGGYQAMGKYKMQREFWGNTAFSAIPWINENARENASVDFHDTNWDSYNMYLRDGILRPDIKAQWDYRNADYHLFHWHKEFLDIENEVKAFYGTQQPVAAVSADGVPLLNVYENPAKDQENSAAGSEKNLNRERSVKSDNSGQKE